MTAFTLADLARLIAERAASTGDKSYTRSLLDAGPARVARKFGEEAIEAIIAAIDGERNAIRDEAADVLYHLLVLLQVTGVPYLDVVAELQRRTAQSGHAEKASRPSSG